MKPRETKVDGHMRNRETAPLKGAVAGFGAHAARGSVAGRWAARTDSQPNIRGAITWTAISQRPVEKCPLDSLCCIQKG
jgi:hypothetical protein